MEVIDNSLIQRNRNIWDGEDIVIVDSSYYYPRPRAYFPYHGYILTAYTIPSVHHFRQHYFIKWLKGHCLLILINSMLTLELYPEK